MSKDPNSFPPTIYHEHQIRFRSLSTPIFPHRIHSRPSQTVIPQPTLIDENLFNALKGNAVILIADSTILPGHKFSFTPFPVYFEEIFATVPDMFWHEIRKRAVESQA
ncbi:hypothetical protein V5O48_017866 [Marasmius crinis-equi]|uniref:Uncharacterized protein n=1 Tax=Marasmius crinis-equi TaxID=585013 RepID=A0ABR3EMS5_9AGAR